MKTESREQGFTLVEILLAASIMATVIVAISPLFVVSLKTNANASDLTSCVSLAQEQIEKLKNLSWDTLPQGGSIDTPVSGFSEYVDTDTNGRNDFLLAWSVSNVGTLSSALSATRIHVREIGVTCTTLRANSGQTGRTRKVTLNTYRTRGVE